MIVDPKNLKTPFQRDKKRDFASAEGADLLRSKVLQAIMTRGTTPNSSGELPWRTAFGAGLDLFRHQRNEHALSELAKVTIRDALKKWVPDIEFISVQAARKDATVFVQVKFKPSGKSQVRKDFTLSIEL